ncbi:glycoside hydrolase family protein [Flavicella sediminum]|uniref:glycoside hydrolase family protein n=1 Tax=Flavicella sediminum TaxID=2585141 RepID=UPI00111E7AE6|nr:glycoside hydrolase family protein [Flavicella sediminum]
MKNKIFILLTSLLCLNGAFAQISYRPLPAEWEKLVEGGNFMDRILPMPDGKLAKNVWGDKAVLPRYIDNGIEDGITSYWGGNILKGDDGKFHFFLCGWPEKNPDGHMGYKTYSTMYHAVGDNSVGPFKVKEELGEGHNTEIIQLKDGRYMIYHVTGHEVDKHCNYLISDNLNGPWERKVLPLDTRDRPTRIGGGNWFHNLSFTKREDGSVLMLSRQGSIWVSKTGTSPYHLITTKSIYPMVSGRYEDPVIWKDHIQYNAIVNDWIGRTAFYMRSKDGVNWVIEEGRAYAPGVAVHKDGKKEDWYKYERIRMFQDEYGRAIQANFAVIDYDKHQDLPNDKHSSKNISLPLNPGMLLTIENKTPIEYKTKEIKVRIKAEKNFDPIKEVDLSSLRFGASSEVNYGRGAKAIKSEKDGKDLIVVFTAKDHCISDDVFAPKMLGKTKKGALLFGYARLPWLEYIAPILSARKPEYKNGEFTVVVENDGQVASKKTFLTINSPAENGVVKELTSVLVPEIKPYGKAEVTFQLNKTFVKDKEYPVVLKILSRKEKPITFETTISKN